LSVVIVSGAIAFVRCSSSTPPSSGTSDNNGNTGNPSASGVNFAAAHPGFVAKTDDTLVTATQMVTDGRQTFRYDTFGDEAFWGGTLKLHQAIEGSAHGGVGDGVSPKTALTVGLKVDVDALPAA